MATKFLVWIDNPSTTNLLDYTTFSSAGSQRESGFVPGTAASAPYVNAALRQSSLVASALMDIVDNSGTYDYTASVAQVKTKITDYLNGLTVNKATNADITTNNANNNVVDFQIGSGTKYQKTINNVANVTTSINGNNISAIFESNGTTVKNATNASTVTNGVYTTDINKSGVTQFGEWVVPKRRLLASGSDTMLAKNTYTQIYNSSSGTGSLAGRTFEIGIEIYGKTITYQKFKIMSNNSGNAGVVGSMIIWAGSGSSTLDDGLYSEWIIRISASSKGISVNPTTGYSTSNTYFRGLWEIVE